MTDNYDISIKKVSILLNSNYDAQIFCDLNYTISIQFRVLSSVHGIFFLTLFSNFNHGVKSSSVKQVYNQDRVTISYWCATYLLKQDKHIAICIYILKFS